jgi:lysophospholipase L1-like esterase
VHRPRISRSRLAIVLSLAAGLLAAVAGAATAHAAQKQIMVYGDSNTWGWKAADPVVPATRYPLRRTWPHVMQASLGGKRYNTVVEGLSGRTTDADDPTVPQLEGAGLNGAEALPPILGSHLPLHLVAIMLGSNDTKASFNRGPTRIAEGARKLVRIVKSSGRFFGTGWYPYPAPKVLLIAPPPFGDVSPWGDVFAGAPEKSRQLAAPYRQVARSEGVSFFNAGRVISTADAIDGVHLTAKAHRTLGRAAAERVRRALRAG